jgi:hypothetical protein
MSWKVGWDMVGFDSGVAVTGRMGMGGAIIGAGVVTGAGSGIGSDSGSDSDSGSNVSLTDSDVSTRGMDTGTGEALELVGFDILPTLVMGGGDGGCTMDR